jgi:teichuronic acid biosynthesis glycosyltransferase TuaG
MNDNNIKFSVIIPAYNGSKFIKNTLDSIRNQTYKNYEVLVTNDGSTDDTENVLRKYKKNNPKFPLFFFTQKNMGMGAARNNSILHSIGEYSAFLDQDDWWFSQKLEKVAQILSANINIDVLYHDIIIAKENGKESLYKAYPMKQPAYYDLLFNGNKLAISAAVVKSRKLKEIGGFTEDLSFHCFEDYDLWLRLTKENAKFYCISDTLGAIFYHKESTSNKIEYYTKNSLNILRYHFNLAYKEKEYEKRFLDKKYRRRKSVIIFGASRKFYRLNNYNKALKYSIKALKTDFTFWKSYPGLLMSYLKLKCSRV